MRAISAAALVLLAGTYAAAAPEPPRPMTEIVREADLIVVGTLTDVQFTENEQGRDYSAVLEIEDTLYGEPARSVTLLWGTGAFLCQGFFDLDENASVRAIWFLRRDGSGFTIDHHKCVIYLSHPVDSFYRYGTFPEALAELAEGSKEIHDDKVDSVLMKLKAFASTPRRATRRWNIEVEWGSSPLLGSAVNVTLESDGHLRARKIGPPAPADTSPAVYESRLSPSSAEHLRDVVQAAIHAVDPSQAQGSMTGDGGHIYVYLWDGTVALATQAHLLRREDEAGPPLAALVGEFRKLLPGTLESAGTR